MTVLRRLLSAKRLFKPFFSFRSFSSNVNNNNVTKSKFTSKIGILLGLSTLPIFGFFIYDRFAKLPEELKNLNFPLPARVFIRRAICPANSIQETARFLDLALQKVLAAGIGSASPESTALVLYLARLYLEDKNVNVSDLEAAHYTLTFKPHVGEAVREELARIDLSFKLADRLCSFYTSAGHEDAEKVQFYAKTSLEFMENGPNYIKSQFEDHPLHPKFKQLAAGK